MKLPDALEQSPERKALYEVAGRRAFVSVRDQDRYDYGIHAPDSRQINAFNRTVAELHIELARMEIPLNEGWQPQGVTAQPA